MSLENDEHSMRLLRFLSDTLREISPVAPNELYYDSQTRLVINQISQIEKPIRLLDYGCGNLRLSKGINESKEPLPEIQYYATDITPPGKELLENVHFIPLSELRREYPRQFDLIVLMNVIHEVSIQTIGEIFEDCRRLLNSGGRLMLVDMSVLPEGEPQALPFYTWELSKIFSQFEDLSYTSKSGIPIVILQISKYGIPVYSKLTHAFSSLVQQKRNTYSQVACSLHDQDLVSEYAWLNEKLSLSGNRLYDLGLLMLMSGHANFRWIEYATRELPNNVSINDAAIEILKMFFKEFQRDKKIISLNDIFQELGAITSYEAISSASVQMSNSMGCFFFPLKSASDPLQPTESLDAFEDFYSYDDIKEKGLQLLQYECHNRMWPE